MLIPNPLYSCDTKLPSQSCTLSHCCAEQVASSITGQNSLLDKSVILRQISSQIRRLHLQLNTHWFLILPEVILADLLNSQICTILIILFAGPGLESGSLKAGRFLHLLESSLNIKIFNCLDGLWWYTVHALIPYFSANRDWSDIYLLVWSLFGNMWYTKQHVKMSTT